MKDLMQKNLQLREWLTQFLLLEGLMKENHLLITVGATGTGQDQEVRTDAQGIITETETEDLQLLGSLERGPKVPSMEGKRRNTEDTNTILNLVPNLEAEVEKDVAARDPDHILTPEESINIGLGLILIPGAERSIDTSQDLEVDPIQVPEVRRKESRVLTLNGSLIIAMSCILASTCIFVSHARLYNYIFVSPSHV